MNPIKDMNLNRRSISRIVPERPVTETNTEFMKASKLTELIAKLHYFCTA